ncbi:MAG: hypothetical protein M1835_002920 [Candelina submexicana]|nr:MAG: hypothetical protein M1835_002920 [Candelina submexicana]
MKKLEWARRKLAAPGNEDWDPYADENEEEKEEEIMELPDDDADSGLDRFSPDPDDEAQERPQAEKAAIGAGGDDRSGEETPEK